MNSRSTTSPPVDGSALLRARSRRSP
jgi:hypothetical protein